MNASIIQALVRHVLTIIAGGLAVKYNVDGGMLDAVVAGGAALAGIGWSVYDKRK